MYYQTSNFFVIAKTEGKERIINSNLSSTPEAIKVAYEFKKQNTNCEFTAIAQSIIPIFANDTEYKNFGNALKPNNYKN